VPVDTIKLHPPSRPGANAKKLWPPEVDLILSAMEAARDAASQRAGGEDADQRVQGRLPYRVRAELTLFSDPPAAEPWILYTRDADQRGIGFITPHRLPLGYGGWIDLLGPSGRKMRIPCTLFRCRQAVQGWYEGALYFNREQWSFAPEL
jgi:hypothetical protein